MNFFTTETIDDITILILTVDRLDAENAEKFKKSAQPVILQAKKVMIDFSNLAFIDSAGCGAMISCLKQMNTIGGELKFFGVREPVATVFKLARINRIIDILDTREQAIRSFY